MWNIKTSGASAGACSPGLRTFAQRQLNSPFRPDASSLLVHSKQGTSEKLATCPLDLNPLHWILNRRGHLHKDGGLHARGFGNEVVISKFEVTSSSEGWRRWRSRDGLKGCFGSCRQRSVSPNRIQREEQAPHIRTKVVSTHWAFLFETIPYTCGRTFNTRKYG